MFTANLIFQEILKIIQKFIEKFLMFKANICFFLNRFSISKHVLYKSIKNHSKFEILNVQGRPYFSRKTAIITKTKSFRKQ